MFKIITTKKFNAMLSAIEGLQEINASQSELIESQKTTINVNDATIRNMAKKLSTAMFRNPKTGRFEKVQDVEL